MANIETKPRVKNLVEFKKEVDAKGVTLERLMVNGVLMGVMGSCSEEDRKKAIETLETALETVEDPEDPMELMRVMNNIETVAKIAEAGLTPDDQVDVCGETVLLQYAQKNAVTVNGEEVANINDLPDLPVEAAKTVLVERAKLRLHDLH